MCKLLLVLVARRGCPRKILGKPGREDVSEQFSVQFGSDEGLGSPIWRPAIFALLGASGSMQCSRTIHKSVHMRLARLCSVPAGASDRDTA